MSPSSRTTLATVAGWKRSARKVSVLTCYDYPTARLMESAGVDILLVGDTSAEVVLGLESTREAPPEFLITLTQAVRRGAPTTFVMADLPFKCRSGSCEATIDWARRFFEETGADAVKIEVTGEDVGLVQAMANAGIPVVAHIGLLPQHVDPAAGYHAQGKNAADGHRLIREARELESAGSVMLLLEAVTSEVARAITQHAGVPVIGCVAGPHCDGTVVVLHDMIGLDSGHPPRRVRRYETLTDILMRAFESYADDIRAGRFPTENDSPHMQSGEYEKLMSLTGES